MREANVVSQLHVCRGNFTRQESSLLEGNYEKLSDFFVSVAPDMLTLELSTPRAGDISALFSNPELAKKVALGVGVVNPRITYVETPEEIVAAVEQAMEFVQDPQRIWLNPDCGFATFANRPMNEMDIIRQKLDSMVKAQAILRSKYA